MLILSKILHVLKYREV